MPILHTLLLPLLIFLSWVYGLIIWVRNYLYNIGLFKSISFDIPIISIGNITTGGTGKTPMVIYLTRLLEKNGYKPGIVSRGYGRNSRGPILVHDSNSLLTDVEKSGDEPYLMGKELQTIPIVVSENRITGIQQLLNNNRVDIIILDDAFQHRKVKRNLDIVMISSRDELMNYHLLPWGKLREPIRSLKRAQCVIYTMTKQYQNPPLHNMLNPYMNNVPSTSIMKSVLMKMDETGYCETKSIAEPVFAFCGIGNPNSFIHNVEEMGLNLIGKQIFQDHQKYNPKVLSNLLVQVQNAGCRVVVTTEKDLVKIPDSFIQQFIFYVIKIVLVFENDPKMIDLIKPVFPNPSQGH